MTISNKNMKRFVERYTQVYWTHISVTSLLNPMCGCACGNRVVKGRGDFLKHEHVGFKQYFT